MEELIRIIKDMVMGYKNGQMELYMLELLKIAMLMEKVSLLILLEIIMRGSGLIQRLMDKVNLLD